MATEFKLIRIISLLIIVLSFINHANAADTQKNLSAYDEGIYTKSENVAPGEDITFYYYVNTPTIPKIDQFQPENQSWKTIHRLETIPASKEYRKCTPQTGCNWQDNFIYEIPSTIEPGIYRASIASKEGSKRFSFFTIYSNQRREVLYLIDYQTPCAYNIYSGGSFYGRTNNNGELISGGVISGRRTYSCNRPNVFGDFSGKPFPRPRKGLDSIAMLSQISRKWHNKINYYGLSASSPLTIDLLKKHKLIIISGIFEYMSRSQHEIIVQYLKEGGRLILNAREYIYGTVEINSYRNELNFIHYSYKRKENYPHDLFGVSLSPNRWVESGTKTKLMHILEPKHTIWDGDHIERGDALFKVGPLTAGGYVSVDSNSGKRCLASEFVTCKNSIVLAEARWISKASNTSAVIALVRIGKGLILVTPGAYFTHATDKISQRLKSRMLDYMLRVRMSSIDENYK
ncbi:MAG: hypothetical protein CL885_02780 [Dehalococcoidia bacterium]|nr:hypothetical protein [Dehalococcoidia bacterium]